jgi:hypothetical protein
MEHKYLKLIVEIFESIQQIKDFTIEQKKKRFRELLLKQFGKEEHSLISETDFLNICNKEVQYLKKNVISIINERREGKLISYALEIELNILNNSIDKNSDPIIYREKAIKLKEGELGKIYGRHTTLDITKFAKTAKREICINDIEFIESVFEPISFTEPKQPEPELLDISGTTAVENKITKHHYKIFSENGFTLFEHILDKYVKPKDTTGRYEDLSYHYRRLFKDEFIHQKPEPFRLWFMKEYDEGFSKIKTEGQTKNTQRKKDYSAAREWFSLQNK